MPTFNFAEKYAQNVDERFSHASITNAAFNNDFDWEGVSTVNIYSVSTAPLNNYLLTGNERYGNADELGTSVQSLTLSQDKAFTFTIDRRNLSDQMMITNAGRALRRQLDEVIIPFVDAYRLSALAANAGTITPPTPLSSPYDAFLNGVTTLLANNVPQAGTVCFISENFYKGIRLDSAFIQPSDTAQSMLIAGQVGTVNAIPLIFAPLGCLPQGVEFILTNRSAAVAPIKLADYKTHDNPPGINGWLVEGRIYFDAFVLNNKKNAVYVHKSA